jgi:hypothetical protein
MNWHLSDSSAQRSSGAVRPRGDQRRRPVGCHTVPATIWKLFLPKPVEILERRILPALL